MFVEPNCKYEALQLSNSAIVITNETGGQMALKVGETASDFTLQSQDSTIRLSDLRGQYVVIYFYPKDDTPGCTVESCSFRDRYDEFKALDAVILGVSSDSPASHAAFAEKFALPFPLLADRGGQLRKLWRVPKTLGIMPGRVTYVIDKEGVVRHIFKSATNPRKHIDEALRVLRELT